jgi:hypothetical protein
VKTEHGKIFGAYMSKPLSLGKSGNYITDPNAFIFSISEKKKFLIKHGLTDKAARNVSDKGPVFGGGYDFGISDKCDQNSSSNSYFGHTYSLPPGLSEDKARAYLAGSQSFKVVEYEVFKCI